MNEDSEDEKVGPDAVPRLGGHFRHREQRGVRAEGVLRTGAGPPWLDRGTCVRCSVGWDLSRDKGDSETAGQSRMRLGTSSPGLRSQGGFEAMLGGDTYVHTSERALGFPTAGAGAS